METSILIELDNHSFCFYTNGKVFLLKPKDIEKLKNMMNTNNNNVDLYVNEKTDFCFQSLFLFYIYFVFYSPKKFFHEKRKCTIIYNDIKFSFKSSMIDDVFFRLSHLLSDSEYYLVNMMVKNGLKNYRMFNSSFWCDLNKKSTKLNKKRFNSFPLLKKKQHFPFRISSMPCMKNKNDKLWFAYSNTYSFADDKYFMQNEKRNYSAWFDFKSSSLAKKKCFFESIERYYSWYCSNKWSMNFIDYSLVNKVIWCDIFKNKPYFSDIVAEITIEKDFLELKNNDVFFPLDVLYYPYESILYNATSSWVSFYKTFEWSILRSTLELIERDAIMKSWLEKLSFSILDKKTIPQKYLKIINNIEFHKQKEVYILDMSIHSWIPTFLSIIRYEENWEDRVDFWSASSLSKDLALEKSLSELYASLFHFESKYKRSYDNFDDFFDVSDHLWFYITNKHTEKIKYILWSSIISYKEIPCYPVSNNDSENCSFLFSLLKRTIGWSFYCYDLTPSFLKEQGFYIVRILSENLIPIWFGKNKYLPLLKDRLWKLKNFDTIPQWLHFYD